jgi:toxin ParE1/3/4
MANIIRSPLAAKDLFEIWSYVAEKDETAADGLLDDLARVSRTLAENPGAGRTREELFPGLRSFPVGNYLVFYRALEDGIEVVRVIHGAMTCLLSSDGLPVTPDRR